MGTKPHRGSFLLRSGLSAAREAVTARLREAVRSDEPSNLGHGNEQAPLTGQGWLPAHFLSIMSDGDPVTKHHG